MSEKTKETEEEIREAHQLRDEKSMNQKIRAAMLEIVKMEKPDDDFSFYKHVMENFSKGEMAHVVCIFIAKEMVEKLQNNTEFSMLIKMLAMLESKKSTHE